MIKTTNVSRFLKTVTLLCMAVTVAMSTTVSAVDMSDEARDELYSSQGILFFDPTQASAKSVCKVSGETGVDYEGNQVISDAQQELVKQNQSVYIEAAEKEDVPWQLLAVIHLRETGLKRINPSNGQGVYQFLNKGGGPYPTGPVDDAEFLRQTILAAQFLKRSAGGNVEGNKELTASSGPDVIKDTLFSYNGRAGIYAQQAEKVGFSSKTQPYEGSPYVMNRADKNRDPNYNKTTWGQVKRDHGPIEYPANSDYGAFVVYAAIAGLSATCDGASTSAEGVRGKVVELAKAELQLWQGSSKPSFTKYTNGGRDNWCSWFTSWLYNQAGYPLNEKSKNGEVPSVSETMSIGQKGERFEWHDKDSSYTPQPGDIVVMKNNSSHVHLVTAVNGGKITIIGGNQGYGSGGQATNFSNSIVSEYTYDWKSEPKVTGFVSPKGQ